MSGGDSSYPESFTTLDVYVLGCLCEGACCRSIVQRVHARVYSGGDASWSWYQPGDPMRGGSYSEEQSSSVPRLLHIWQQWADATE